MGNFGSLVRHLIQRHTLLKHCCRHSMHIHINKAKSGEGNRKERKHEA